MLDHDKLIRGEATLPGLLRQRAGERGDQVALREKIHGIWRARSWADYYRDARRAAFGLAKLGLKQGDRIIIAGEDVPAERTFSCAQRDFRLTVRTGLVGRFSGLSVIIVERDFLFKAAMTDRRAGKVENDAVGLDDAGFDDDHVDAEGLQLQAQTITPAFQRMLGGVVPCAERGVHLTAHAADVDDAPFAGFAHVRDHQLGDTP